MNLEEVTTAHASLTATLASTHRDLARQEVLAEEQWATAFSYAMSSESSATGREQVARAASSVVRRECIRLRGEIAALEAEERWLARQLEALRREGAHGG